MRFPNLLKAGMAGLLLTSTAVVPAAALGENPCGRKVRDAMTNAHMERMRFGKVLAEAVAGRAAVALATVRGVNAGAGMPIVLEVDEWIVAAAREMPPSITVKPFGLVRYENPNEVGGISRVVRPAPGMKVLVFLKSESEAEATGAGPWTVDVAFDDPATVPAARAGVAFHERFSAGTATPPESLSDEYFAQFYDTYLTEGVRPQVELHVRLLLDYVTRAQAYDRPVIGFALARYLSPRESLRPETRLAVEAAIVREAASEDTCAGGMSVRALEWAMTAGGLDVTPHLDAGALERLAANYRAYFTYGTNVPRLPAVDRVLEKHGAPR